MGSEPVFDALQDHERVLLEFDEALQKPEWFEV
jgi:hypothetical protein